MGLTVSEKDHFKIRLNERALELTGEILNEDPNWARQLTKDAVEITVKHYDLEERMAELKKWRKRERAVNNKLEELKRDMVAHVRGLKPEHVDPDTRRGSGNAYYYRTTSMPTPAIPEVFNDSDFQRYPGAVSDIIREHAKVTFTHLAEADGVGKRIAKLRDKVRDFQDRLVAAATHAQLQTTWKEITEEFNMIAAESQGRQLRKVETTRNEEAPKPRGKRIAKK